MHKWQNITGGDIGSGLLHCEGVVGRGRVKAHLGKVGLRGVLPLSECAVHRP